MATPEPKSIKIFEQMVEVDMTGNQCGDESGCFCGPTCLFKSAAALALFGNTAYAATDLLNLARSSYAETCISEEMRDLVKQLVKVNS